MNEIQEKWGTDEVPIEMLIKKISDLENRIIKLEEENIETSNVLYELSNSLDAVDARIDIIAENPWMEQFN